jgi:hypothetical protein
VQGVDRGKRRIEKWHVGKDVLEQARITRRRGKPGITRARREIPECAHRPRTKAALANAIAVKEKEGYY